MTNKFKCLLILLFAPLVLMANSGVVVLQRGDVGDGWSGGGTNGIPLPRVSYDDSSITISCDSTIVLIDVIVKDIQGNILIEDSISLNHTFVLHHFPESMGYQRFRIELYFDNRFYYGYFDH